MIASDFGFGKEAEARKLSYRDVAGFLQWSHSKVTKKLTGRTMIDLDEAEALCFAVGLSITEAVRDRGLEFCTEMTPTELRRHELLRLLPKPTVEAIDHLLRVNVDAEKRGATTKGRRRAG